MNRDEQVKKDAGALGDVVFKTLDNAIVEPADDDANAKRWTRWFDDQMRSHWVDAIGDAIGEMTGNLAKQIRALELQVAELKGELRAMRSKKLWTPDA
jgi:hypothetical protein